ncbi:unnamed protein product [Discosporangium mesarthrocarpum]
MDCSALIGALQREPLDQRAVAENLVQFTKTLKSGGLRERSGTTSSIPASPVLTRRKSTGGHIDVGSNAVVGEVSGSAGEAAGPDSQGEGAEEVGEQQLEKQKGTGDGVLVALIRSFRGGMMRVESNLRAAMFRAVRYLINSPVDAELLHQQRFGLFIALALAREQFELWERMQALHFYHSCTEIVDVDSSVIPRDVVQTLVVVSGHMEDNFRRVCLETLRELALANPRVVAQANGFQTLFAAALEPATQDMVDILLTSLMSIIEDPNARKYIRPQLDIHQLLSGFTDLDTSIGPERMQRWQATRSALVVLMRSWTGLHLVASDPRGLVTLMQVLRAPSAATSEDHGLHDVILETMWDIFAPLVGMCRGHTPDGTVNRHRDASMGDRPLIPSIGMAGVSTPAPPGSAAVGGGGGIRHKAGPGYEAPNLLNSYGAMVCAAFVHCGVIPSLSALGIFGATEELRSKAAGLLADILHLCSMFLSQNQCTRLLSMPGLVQLASDSRIGHTALPVDAKHYGGVEASHLARSRASRASDLIRMLHGSLGARSNLAPLQSQQRSLGHIDQQNLTVGDLMQKVVQEANWAMESLDEQHGWMSGPSATLHNMRKELRLSMESSVDRTVLDNQMAKSKVLVTKDWTKWDWDTIEDMVQDTLAHPPRLAEALATKWVKRVSGFYRFVGAGSMGTATDRGYGGGLHNMPWDPKHIGHLSCACRLYTLLLKHPEGVQFLLSEPRGGIFQEIVKELELVTSRRGSGGGSGSGRFGSASKVFDMESCQRRLSAEYMTLLFGVATSTEAGRDLLSKTNLFHYLTEMGSHSELDYLSRAVLTRMDFASEEYHARDVLQIWMATGSRSLRLFATNLMRALLRRGADFPAVEGMKAPMKASEISTAGGHESGHSVYGDGFEQWGIDTLVTQLHYDDPGITRAALSVLEEAAKDDRYLQSLVQKRPDLLNKSGAGPLLMRFLSLPDGVEYLEELGWVEGVVQQWRKTGNMTAYSAHVDTAMKAHLSDDHQLLDEDTSSSFGDEATLAPDEGNTQPIPIRLQSLLLHEPQTYEGQALQIILRLPWNIEVVLSRDMAPAGSQLMLDTWVDASPRAPQSGITRLWGAGNEAGKALVIRGILIDGTGKPACHPVESNLTLHARLCVGACAMDRLGNVQPLSTAPSEAQTTPIRRHHRGSRSSRVPTQQTRGDLYGSSAFFRGGQGMPEFGLNRDTSEDMSELNQQQQTWSTCRPRQRAASVSTSASAGRGGGDTEILHGKSHNGSPEQPGVSPSHEGSVLDGGPPHMRGFNSMGDREEVGGRGEGEEEVKVHEYGVHVHGYPARWVFTNHPEPEDITMQVVETNSVTFLKAVEFTISLENFGPGKVSLPPHLYGELAKTEKGCDLLRMHGELEQMMETAKDTSAPAEERKGALWGLAHVSRWPPGMALLQEYGEDFVTMLTSMMTSHLNLSVWGTCFSAMSLVGQTVQGRAAIRNAGWERARDPTTNVYLPQDPAALFKPVPWEFHGSPAQFLDEEPVDPIVERITQELTEDEREVLKQVAKLSSHISRKEARSRLARMRKSKTHKASFTSSIRVFILVHQLLTNYSFSLPVRRFIFELFEQATLSSSDWEPYIDC